MVTTNVTMAGIPDERIHVALTANDMPSLQTELQTYHHHLPSMLADHKGKYVVIKERHIAYFADRYEEALEWGYKSFGLDNFFVKQITQDRDVVRFTHGPTLITQPSP